MTTTEQNTQELYRIIKKNQLSINSKTTNVKKAITTIQSEILQQLTALENLRNQNRSEFISTVSSLINITKQEADSMFKDYQRIRSNMCDRKFMMLSNIIERPVKNKPKKKNITLQSPIMTVGNLISNITDLNERRQLTKNNKDIIKNMLKELADKL